MKVCAYTHRLGGNASEREALIEESLRAVGLADGMPVMKDGRVVEFGPSDRIFEQLQTDYTRALMAAAFDLAVTEGGGVSQ